MARGAISAEEHTMSMSRITGLTLLAAALFLLCLGVSTYFWPTTEGTIIDVKHTLSFIDQTPTGVPASKHSRPRNTVVRRTIARYSYSVDSQQYSSNAISLLNDNKITTIGETRLQKGEVVRVSYLPFFQNYSVLEPGTPFPIFFSLFLAGITLLQYRLILGWFIATLVRKRNLRLMIHRKGK